MVGAILGNYRIISQIDGGGMGTVYRAQHALLERPAAVKLLRRELSSNESLAKRFFNEAQAATRIGHPGIVEVYDFGYTEDGLAYIVMELLEGATLSARLAERGRFAEPEAAYLGRCIASALRAAHAKSIFHRDLKPDNIFLIADPDAPTGERIKILDFGIAKLADDRGHTQTGALIGTPIYMAPEQARAARAIDHRADLYSLGCMLYELLTGAPPFVAEGAGEIIAMHLFTQPMPPSTLAAVSPEMDAIVMRLLAKEPHDRFEGAKDVVDALNAVGGFAPQISGPFAAVGATGPGRVLESQPNRAVPASASLRLSLIDEPRPPERRSSMALVAGAITLAIAAAVAIVVAMRGDEPPAPSPTAAPAPPPAPAPTPLPAVVDTPPAHVEAPAATPAPVITRPPPKRPAGRPDVRDPTPPRTLPAPPPPKPRPTGPVTPNGSPFYDTLEDKPAQPPRAGSAIETQLDDKTKPDSGH